MTAASITHPRVSQHPLVDTVVGRLLEWMVLSVEGVRARFYRGVAR
jgi:hypothetical protein